MTDTTEPPETTTDSPLLDLTDAGVKKFIKSAKARGYVTLDELNKVMPSEEFTSEQLEDTLSMLSEMGVNVVEAEEDAASDGEGSKAVAPAAGTEVVAAPTKEPTFDRTDDPVRMYLREMGAVELLSREGEIAIAKRIEAGRDTMIRGLCESALTFEAIMVWRDELRQGRILLREIIDLDGTYGAQNPRPDATAAPAEAPAPVSNEVTEDGDAVAAAEASEEDDFDDGAGPTVSAMEAELREGVMATLDAVADCFEVFRKLQEKLVERRLRGADLTAADRTQYEQLNGAIVGHLKTLKLNNNRIEALVEQLYAINKKLMGLEGRLLRLADSYGISRGEFLRAYFGSELDPSWRARVRDNGVRWAKFADNESGQIDDIRGDVAVLATSRACPSTTSAASSRRCRRASARPVRPRRRWSRPIFASSSASPRSTPTAACSSWT
jgi:RNA polymerase primary sigma factor